MRLKKLKYWLLAGMMIIISINCNAQFSSRYPTNARFIAGGYNDARPFFKTLNAALNDVKALATSDNPYTFWIMSDTTFVADWDSVYNGDKTMRDSIEVHYVTTGKIIWAGVLVGGQLTYGTIEANIEANDFDLAGVWEFADSVITKGIVEVGIGLVPSFHRTRYIGIFAKQFLIMYGRWIFAERFFVLEPDASDTTKAAIISYDGTVLNFDKPLSLDKGMSMDSSSTVDVFNFTPHPYTIAVEDAGDTILTLTTSDLYSSIKLNVGGNISPGISKLQIDTATEGMILRFYNVHASLTVIFKDIVSGDDNLYMEGDFTLGQYDNIEFECVDATKAAQKWIELRRKNN